MTALSAADGASCVPLCGAGCTSSRVVCPARSHTGQALAGSNAVELFGCLFSKLGGSFVVTLGVMFII